MFDVQLDRVRFPDGSEGQLEVLRHPGAAAVVPLYVEGERPGGTRWGVVLLRQYRYAAGGCIWEIPAGKLDGEEAPESCARRELEEEAGLKARKLTRLASVYTTPGFTDERIHLFLATGLEAGRPSRERDEFMETHVLDFEQALEFVRDGRIVDAKTVCALLYVASFLDAERATGMKRSGAV
ncbi:MAG: NUDIX hydrolase [Gemmatimonadota bacterium]